MWRLKVYVDIYGRIGMCEKFPDDEEHMGLNEMLEELVDLEFYGDRYPKLTPGFYMAVIEMRTSHKDIYDSENYLQIRSMGVKCEG